MPWQSVPGVGPVQVDIVWGPAVGLRAGCRTRPAPCSTCGEACSSTVCSRPASMSMTSTALRGSTSRCWGSSADQRIPASRLRRRRRSVLLLSGAAPRSKPVPHAGGTIPPHDGHGPLHMAFCRRGGSVAAMGNRLREQGVEIEGRTDWSRGGHSISSATLTDTCLEWRRPLMATY